MDSVRVGVQVRTSITLCNRQSTHLEVGLHLLHVLALAQPPAESQPVDVRVDGEGRVAEGLGHDDGRRLVSHAGQGLQVLEGVGHLAAEALADLFDMIPEYQGSMVGTLH